MLRTSIPELQWAFSIVRKVPLTQVERYWPSYAEDRRNHRSRKRRRPLQLSLQAIRRLGRIHDY